MTMRVLLVDDEPPALERLAAFFANLDGVEVVGQARDGFEAQRAMAELKPDLVMLDIQMPGLSGLAVAAGLASDDRPEIVFVTAFEHFAPDAFDVEAADYLLKPVRFDRLRQAVDRARRRRDGRQALLRAAPAQSPFEDAIWVATREGQVRVPIEMIDWVEAAGDYAVLHTELRGYLHRTTMSALQKRLDPAQLRRVHRSAFVRLSKVVEIRRQDKWLVTLVLDNGVEVAVGPNYAREIVAELEGRPAAAAS
jgi:DNA-binding LytR/AlgR family response regulator